MMLTVLDSDDIAGMFCRGNPARAALEFVGEEAEAWGVRSSEPDRR